MDSVGNLRFLKLLFEPKTVAKMTDSRETGVGTIGAQKVHCFFAELFAGLVGLAGAAAGGGLDAV